MVGHIESSGIDVVGQGLTRLEPLARSTFNAPTLPTDHLLVMYSELKFLLSHNMPSVIMLE